MQGGPPVAGGPPGYTGAGGYGPPPGGNLPTANYTRPAAEVEGNSRSKAQLIVGIDFVRISERRRLSGGDTDKTREASLTYQLCREPLSQVSHLPLQQTMKQRKISFRNGQVLDHTPSRRYVPKPTFRLAAELHCIAADAPICYRFQPSYTTINTKRLSAGGPTSPMPSPPPDTRSREYRR